MKTSYTCRNSLKPIFITNLILAFLLIAAALTTAIMMNTWYVGLLPFASALAAFSTYTGATQHSKLYIFLVIVT
jgi:hypothetical protein